MYFVICKRLVLLYYMTLFVVVRMMMMMMDGGFNHGMSTVRNRTRTAVTIINDGSIDTVVVDYVTVCIYVATFARCRIGIVINDVTVTMSHILV